MGKIDLMVFLLLLSLVSVQGQSPEVESMNCYIYECKPSTVAMNPGTCYVRIGGIYYINPCPANQTESYCNLSNGYCEAPTTPRPQNYPGEPCASSSDCYVGSCYQGFCEGRALGESCSDSDQCDAGLFCYNGQCNLQIKIGESCSDDYDCVNWAGCKDSICTDYYSVDVGGSVPDCSGGQSNYCSSLSCEKNGWIGSDGKCTAPPKHQWYPPAKCASNADCTASNGSEDFNGKCTCGYNAEGNAYCQPALGDIQGINMINSWYRALRATTKCNTTRRRAEACLRLSGVWADINARTWEFKYLPLIADNNNCVSETFTHKYYYAGAREILPTLGFFLLVLVN